jgi:hypothetical protein
MSNVNFLKNSEKNSFESSIQELTIDEVICVSGGGIKEAGAAMGVTTTIGAATFGSTWGVLSVSAAFATAPIAVVAMVGLVAYASYQLMRQP